MGGIHFDKGAPAVVHGDIVGGDKITTTIIAAAVRLPTTLLEEAEEAILNASELLSFGESVSLLKVLNRIRNAERKSKPEDVKAAIEDLEKMPGSQVIITIISKMKTGDEHEQKSSEEENGA